MKKKWYLIVSNLFFVLVLAGCGRMLRVREPFSYHFEVGKTYKYKVKIESQVSLEAGLVGYQGNIVVHAFLF